MIGSAILGLMGGGDPSQQLGATLNPNPINPTPGAPPGSAAASGQGLPQPPQQGLAQPQATQSPPDLAALYTKLYDRDQAAHSIDQGTALMASAFGTAQQQHDLMNYAQNIPAEDHVGVANKALLAQKELTDQQEHSRWMAGAAGMSKLLGDNVTPEQAQILSNNPDAFNELLKTHQQVEAAKATPTDAMKNADAQTTQWQTANPGATPEEVAAHRASILSGMLPGPAGEAMKVQAKDKQEFQDTAMNDYTGVQSKLNDTENTIDQLLKDPTHTMAALKDPVPTTGMGANLNPFLSQATADQAVLLNKLKAQFSADALSTVKNVRNMREFTALGQAATGALDPASSQDQVMQALQTMKNKILDARATSELAAGHRLTGDLVGHGNRDLLDKTNPYYNGGSEAASPATSGGGGGKTYTYNPKTGQLE